MIFPSLRKHRTIPATTDFVADIDRFVLEIFHIVIFAKLLHNVNRPHFKAKLPDPCGRELFVQDHLKIGGCIHHIKNMDSKHYYRCIY